MKLMIASDIHGSAYWCEKMMKAFENEGAGRLLLLGDLLYHGPRNDLPEDYAPKKVIPMLNDLADRITAVRGNCDAEVDQMVLEFPVMADYAFFPGTQSKTVYATHGHIHGETNPPPLADGDVLLCGHTHVPKCEVHTGDEQQPEFVYMNPGSVSIPKENSPHSYMTFENGVFKWHSLEETDFGLTYMDFGI